MKIISTGAADILLLDLPEGSRELKVFNDEKPYLSFFEGHTTPRIYLPEGYNYTILDVSDKMTEEQWQSILPNYGGKIFDYDLKHYNSYPDYEFANHPFESKFFGTAIESGHSLLKSQGILLENPFGDKRPKDCFYAENKNGYREKIYDGFQKKWDEYQSKVKNPLVIKAEKIT